ncbi:hypothetical protein [Flavobacterium polysaccharolyticum]|uniref:Uncharacterized protein n=1 Tax=Flavobacterium polysaccharolyticum TaxID=3133148 RepID=A0ABU9NN50_9FLAO
MRKLLVLLCFILSHWGIVNTQDEITIRSEQKPFSEPRFTYFRETTVSFNE